MAKKTGQENGAGRGNKTPVEIEAEFAAEYMRTGIAAVAARKVRISRFTGRDIATRLDLQPEFAQRRSAFLARGLDDVELALLDLVDTAHKRTKAKPVITEMGVSDNGPHWMRALTDLHRSLVARRKSDEPTPTGPVEIRISVGDPEQQKPEPDGGSG